MSTIVTVTQPQNVWIIRPEVNINAKLRLICFPYAGGGASLFRSWTKAFPQNVEVCAVQLPGRENRLKETPFTHIEPLIKSLTAAILPYLDIPFAFFGYSMGSLISFELARQLRKQYKLSPIHLFVAASRGVQLPVIHPIHHLSDYAFIQELNRRYQAIPSIVLQNEELMQSILPTLKADFKILETHIFQPEAAFQCPISAFGGLQDSSVSFEDISAWRDHTNNNFNLEMFLGGHFFINQSHQLLCNKIFGCFYDTLR
ncbi:MAG: thioesterase domain-containing protein [Nodularia sp. (in: cyanobacteria)]|nr:thioesterase domain-containing protein [Nodularia sp. (in: cyanobacteria)]